MNLSERTIKKIINYFFEAMMALNKHRSAFYSRGTKILFVILFFLLAGGMDSVAQSAKVTIKKDSSGMRLQVDGKDFFVKGMNWDFFPVGTNYTYSLWTQPDDVIRAALDREMSLLRNMGVNVIRQYTGVQPKWVQYIYERYGIYTILNHSFGRYGVNLNGAYIPHTDYADPATRDVILGEVTAMVEEFRDVPGLLLWLLGNENNYGLFWGGAATEDIPVGETLESVRAQHMYSLFSDGIALIKQKDNKHPVAIANGDLLFLDIIADKIKNLDIFGTNMYRGYTFTDAFDKVKEKLNVPILFTEFGSDAFNAKENREDQLMQAKYLHANWKDIYEHAAGAGKTGISIGGMTFQFSDGWWKQGQEFNLDVHDITASWANGGYKEDLVEGSNNMNEEWFGICAKGPTDQNGLYELYPRAAYYTLKRVNTLNPYKPGMNLSIIENHFGNIDPFSDFITARGDKAALQAERTGKVRLSGLRMEFETFNTGGEKITTPDDPVPGSSSRPAFLGFDHLQSFYAQIEAKPSENVRGQVEINMLGNVPLNPIDEIFYENRGTQKTVKTNEGTTTLYGNERLKIYKASITWESPVFKLDGFYRTGHFHWGYEGDFFGLYPEANYGENHDIYNAAAPLGFEVAGKQVFDGLKIAFGPELWWGANPAVLVKYRRQLGAFDMTGIYQEDLAKQSGAVSSFAVPLPPTRKATLHVKYTYGVFGVEAGGIWGGNTKVGNTFQLVTGSSGNYTVYQDKIKASDAFGGKLKVTFSNGPFNWYAQGGAMGLVADGGVNPALTFTGWRLKDAGTGNQYNFLSGFAYTIDSWQIAPNFLYQKPIEGPIPGDVPAPGRPRNILSDPFAVRANRETIAGELLINFDPTPATWLYSWDSDIREDALYAFSAGFIFRHQPTTQDAAIGILADGRTLFAFPGAPMARDVWETYARIISKLGKNVGMIANIYGGTGEPNGSDSRLIHRYGGYFRFIMNSIRLTASVKINDWGPYDYHKDFNLTYPLQLMADVSANLGTPQWFELPQTRIGLRGTWRSLDKYSSRYQPVMMLNEAGNLVPSLNSPGQPEGNEWEIRTYLHFSI